MTNTKKPTALERGGLSNMVLLGGEPTYPISLAGQFQQRARGLYAEALGLRGADRHAALSLSRHFGQAGWRGV